MDCSLCRCVSIRVVSYCALVYRTVVLTLELRNAHPERIALVQYPLSPTRNEVVEPHGKLGHALAQLIEAEVDAGERVRHRGSSCAELRLGAGERRREARRCQVDGHDVAKLVDDLRDVCNAWCSDGVFVDADAMRRTADVNKRTATGSSRSKSALANFVLASTSTFQFTSASKVIRASSQEFENTSEASNLTVTSRSPE